MAIPELVTYAYGAWCGLRKKPLNSVAPPCLPPLPLLTPDTALGGSGRWGMEGETRKALRNVFYVTACALKTQRCHPAFSLRTEGWSFGYFSPFRMVSLIRVS